jgi:hypothetical protein
MRYWSKTSVISKVKSKSFDNLRVENGFIFGTKIEFYTDLSLEDCHERLLEIHTNIPTGIFWYNTQIYVDSVKRLLSKKNKMGEEYYLTFKIVASVSSLFRILHIPNDNLLSYEGQIIYLDNDTTAIRGKIQISERFLTKAAVFFAIFLVVMPVSLLFMITGNFQFIPVLLVFALASIEFIATLKCKDQLIETIYQRLTA